MKLPNKCPHEFEGFEGMKCGEKLIFSVTGYGGYDEYLRAWCENCRWNGYWKLSDIDAKEEFME